MRVLNYVRGEALTQRAPSFWDVFGPLITRDFSPVYMSLLVTHEIPTALPLTSTLNRYMTPEVFSEAYMSLLPTE